MSTQKPSKKSGNCRCSGGPPAEWFWEVILCLPDTAVRAESAKKTPPFGWCFWSGRRGSNSLPGIPRMAVAIRRSPASPLDLTRFAQAEAASSPVLRHIPKRIPHPVGWGILFGAGDEARTRFPASHEWLSPFAGALPHLLIRRASHRSRQRVLRCCGTFQKEYPILSDGVFFLERATRLELATSTLARSRSTR